MPTVFFRPAPVMSIAALIALAILLSLGTWQLGRLAWKESLIAGFESRATAAAIAPPVFGRDDIPAMRYQRLALAGVFMHDREVHLTGRTYEGTPGYHVITPLVLDDGRTLLVNRGWVAEDYRRSETRPQSLPQGRIAFEGILRLPRERGRFVPPNDPEADDWFTLNIADIARYHNLDGGRLITAYTADALRPPQDARAPLVLPIAADVSIDISNDHLNYALTWFGIALGLIGVYGAWHHQAGRLGFRRR